MLRILIFIGLIAFWPVPAVTQVFADDPEGMLESSIELAQEIIDDPLRLEGLMSLVLRYNRARVELSPAGYEDAEWYETIIRPLLSNINTQTGALEEVETLPVDGMGAMILAFNKNSASYYQFYDRIQNNSNFRKISPDQMLEYLSAYSVIAHSVDTSLWDRLMSFTGVWPLCFWQQ